MSRLTEARDAFQRELRDLLAKHLNHLKDGDPVDAKIYLQVLGALHAQAMFAMMKSGVPLEAVEELTRRLYQEEGKAS